jgi:hypothetical protein
MWDDPVYLTKALETTPLLDCERGGRHGKSSLTRDSQRGVRHHSPNSSINSQHESSPSCSRPPFYRRSFSAERPLSSDKVVEEPGEGASLDLQCSQHHQPLLSRSGSLCNVRKLVELRLENSGSVARDHLACERTFLAYMRTSLAIAASGVGRSRFRSRAYY